MYSHTFFVTSVRGNDLAPQIAAKASLRLFFAKMPLPAFFMASAFFLALSDCAFLPILRFSAFIFFNAAFLICSWPGLILRYICDDAVGAFSRVKRDDPNEQIKKA